MKIEHIAIWTNQLETMCAFYEKYFNGRANDKYRNNRTGLNSYFLTFDSGARLELMQQDNIPTNAKGKGRQHLGLTHIAFAVGDKTAVNTLTNQLREDGFAILGEPRTTGDGYYESVIQDPDGNRIEITI